VNLTRVGRVADRLARWARMPPPVPGPGRRFVIVQIDGLSERLLRVALDRGRLPFLARLLERDALALHGFPVGLPTSTAAFQARLMYGRRADIPAFEFLDKRTGEYRWFPQPWTASAVEAAAQVGDCPGIMRGGRTYGGIFAGQAEDSVFTFSHLLRPSRGWGTLGVRAMLVPSVILGWVTAKLAAATVVEGARGLAYALRRRRTPPAGQPLPERLMLEWCRSLFTLGITTDVYGGAPALFVDYIGYDVTAHALGPGHPAAFRQLRRIDRAIREIWRAVHRVPELRYDLFVLSDHGQVASVPFETVCPGERFTDVIAAAFGMHARPTHGWHRHTVRAGHLCIVPAGPNINVYLTDVPRQLGEPEIEARYPGALARLSRHPGIGVVLARGPEGVVCHHRGRAFRAPLPAGPSGCPLFDRSDRELVVRELDALLRMPSAGDVMVFGHESPFGCVSYLGERGSHAGPSPDELYGFVLAPPRVRFDWARVSAPEDLYPLFAAYGRAPEGPAARAGPPATGAAARGRPVSKAS
jgi:hypothetical protein